MGMFKAEHESGSIEAIGEGESSVNLDFRPEHVSYQIQGNPHGPISCNPLDLDTISISQSKHNKGKYKLTFKWKVFGKKHIAWQASE